MRSTKAQENLVISLMSIHHSTRLRCLSCSLSLDACTEVYIVRRTQEPGGCISCTGDFVHPLCKAVHHKNIHDSFKHLTVNVNLQALVVRRLHRLHHLPA